MFTKLQKEVKLAPNTSKTIITDRLPSCTITLGKNSTLEITAILTKGWKQNRTITANLKSQHSNLKITILTIGHNSDNFPLEITSNHTTPNTNASYIVRSVLSDESSVNFKGNIVIPKKGQQTKTYLAHHTLMLSPKAKTDTIPCLEITADDVTAGHAATVGQVDEDSLFYLQSRGLTKKESKNLLIKGFLEADISDPFALKQIQCLIPTQ